MGFWTSCCRFRSAAQRSWETGWPTPSAQRSASPWALCLSRGFPSGAAACILKVVPRDCSSQFGELLVPRLDTTDYRRLSLGEQIRRIEVEGYVVLPDLL